MLPTLPLGLPFYSNLYLGVEGAETALGQAAPLDIYRFYFLVFTLFLLILPLIIIEVMLIYDPKWL
jgi:hypothetical protein